MAHSLILSVPFFSFWQILSHGPHFVFSIASLDSFEQKMASAQADLRIASNDFVPIRYRTKNELLYVFLYSKPIKKGFLLFLTNKNDHLTFSSCLMFCLWTRILFITSFLARNFKLIVNSFW